MSNETSDDNPPTPRDEATNAPNKSHLWRKGGPSPNPKGRPREPKTAADVRALAREKTGAMIEFLGRTALNAKAPFNARVQAAIEVLNRGWGRPHQSMDINHGAKDGLAELLDQINGRFQIRTIEGAAQRPGLEAKQPLLDNGQERRPDPIQDELGPGKPDE
jgi:hypothetical protein